MLTAEVAPPNSVLLIMDRSVGQIPESMSRGLVAATPTCIAIGTLSEHDGATRVTLDGDFEPEAQGNPVFDGVLDTPSRKLAVCSVFDDVVLEVVVATERTRVRIWVNDQVEPSAVSIVVSAE
jgi:hypothetical protein